MNDLTKMIIARWMYSIGEPIISNDEYNLLLEKVKKEYPDNEYVHRSWSSDPCPVDILKENGYAYAIRNIVLSDKTESIPSLGNWALVEEVYKNMDEEATLSMKHDGWNIQAAYFNGELVNVQTRGRARDAISAEVLRSKIPNKIPKLGRYTVCMEATVSDENFVKMKSELNARSQRGAVSSCLARPEYTGLIDLHAFSIIGDSQILNPFPVLEEWGFKTPMWILIHNYEELKEGMKTLDSKYQSYGSPTDGVVVRGSVTRAIRLLSWKESVHQSYVTGYNETYGLHRIGVKAEIYPIAMRNSTQRLVSVTNYQRVIDNNLQIGYPIAFTLVSHAIADIDESSTALLQAQWEGRYDEYRHMIEEGERIKNEV